jgi:hypothetical protein
VSASDVVAAPQAGRRVTAFDAVAAPNRAAA